jgi:predicted transcriptional regulator
MPYLVLLISISLSTFSLANTIEVGSSLPSVEINKEGQASIVGEKIVYQPWISTKDMGQRLAYVQHLAARVSQGA